MVPSKDLILLTQKTREVLAMIPVGAGQTVLHLDHHAPYGSVYVALDFLRQAPGRLAQFCRTAALCKDTCAKWSSSHMALCAHYSTLFTYSAYIEHCTGKAIVWLVSELAGSTWAWLLLSEYKHFLQPYRVDVHWFDHYTCSHICTFGSWGIIEFPEFPLTFLSFY